MTEGSFPMAHAAHSLAPAATQPARDMMVDSQVRPNKVTDGRIIQAMRHLPREAFVPAALAALAYADCEIRLGGGRSMLSPMAVARLVQLAAPVAGERALVIAAGTGYGSALLRCCDVEVVALEEDAALAALAADALHAWGAGVRLVSDRAALGSAAFELVIIEGAVATLPDWVVRLVAASGRLVAVRVSAQAGGLGVGQAVIGRRAGADMALHAAFDLNAPLLPAFQAAPGFVF